MLLLKTRDAIRWGQPTKLSVAIRFITDEYRREVFWWEMFDMLRKLILSGGLLLIPIEYNFLRVLVALLMSLCFLVLLQVPNRSAAT